LPWSVDKPYRILSLDGGGIRGAYAASILTDIEAEITGGEPIADYFDAIAGTSTGGIIALGLGLKKPAAAIKQLYIEHGNRVFPEFWSRHPRLKFLRQCFRVLHDQRVLELLLYETFGDATLGQSSARLVIPAFLGPETQIAVLKTDHHHDFKKDHLMAAWEAARATSAAPTFFPGHAGDDYVFLDGGVWANNPIMAVVIDALSAYDVSRDQIEIFSIGTGNAPYAIGKFAVRGGFFRWLEIIKGAMFLTTDNAQAQATLLLGPKKIYVSNRQEPRPQSNWMIGPQPLPNSYRLHGRTSTATGCRSRVSSGRRSRRGTGSIQNRSPLAGPILNRPHVDCSSLEIYRLPGRHFRPLWATGTRTSRTCEPFSPARYKPAAHGGGARPCRLQSFASCAGASSCHFLAFVVRSCATDSGKCADIVERALQYLLKAGNLRIL
jgi:uncharacterized protein